MSKEDIETETETGTEAPDISSLANDDSSTMGDIKINHSVVGNIVRLATLEVDGVISVGSGIVDGIRGIFKGNDSDHGVRVSEDEVGQYNIEVKVQMRFGMELAKVAMEIQHNVTQQVKRMTMKEVGVVDVLIDGIRLEDDSEKEQSEWSDPVS